ncbi:hypothetical protein GGR52DRAFT_521616 [Hypoxylon sp. FL1284]|nr:hypothetical protein GGR52DRAFT_521616 [Hypoxylon sp. FL1284]
MEVLPSYEQAVAGLDWLDLVAPYIPIADWSHCCLVDKRFWRQFAPRLWQDPLVTVRLLGIHPNDELAWYRRFINKHVKSARLETRSYVRSLDFREFAVRASGLYSSDASERVISESFKSLPHIFPGLICLLLDGHPELDPGSLATAGSASQPLQLLDLARCRHELSTKFFTPDLFRDLVFLNISFIPGSVKSATQTSLNPTYLPELRVLRVQGREMDNATASLLVQTFRRQLWSLDLSYNKLGDEVLDEIVEHSVSHFNFHNDSQFKKEGKLVLPKEIGSRKHGPFEFIEESENSCDPQFLLRYFADAPFYSARAGQAEPQEWQAIRPDGLSAIRRDDANTIKRLLLDEAMSPLTRNYDAFHEPRHLGHSGLTHLYLNGNKFTATGIGRLLKTSRGRLEHFECDSCLYNSSHPRISRNLKGLRVSGFLGSAPLFRPVISSALRSLRAHHSLVTQVPSLSAEGLSRTTAARLAEGQLYKNIQRAYPLALVPDTNPRITSLTLTNIPAQSTGPIIERLVNFLQLASSQQKIIRDAKAVFSGRSSSVLSGLAHIRLELEPGFSESKDAISASDEVDFDRLLDPADEDFAHDALSFFDGDDGSFGVTSRSTAATRPSQWKSSNSAANTKEYAHWTSGRLESPPYADVDSEYMTQHVDAADSWTGNVYRVPVWIGPGIIGPHAAVNEYMWNVQDPDLRKDIGPATPTHVAAGVPPLSYIFYAAWDAMVIPKNMAQAAKSAGSEPFKDVAIAIKEYRLGTRGTEHHWDGKLELVRTSR